MRKEKRREKKRNA